MSLRQSFAAVLQLLRTSKGLSQHATVGAVTQSQISRIESGQSTPNLDTTEALANALGIDTVALVAMAVAADKQQTPRDVLVAALTQLEMTRHIDTVPPSQPQQLEAPRVVEGRETRRQVQSLKSEGKTRAQVARELGCSWTTVQRLWGDGDGEKG